MSDVTVAQFAEVLKVPVDRLISQLDEARDHVIAEHGQGPEAVRALEFEAVKVSLANLRSFPCVQMREKDGRLKLHGAYFAIADGILHVLDEDSGTFAAA